MCCMHEHTRAALPELGEHAAPLSLPQSLLTAGRPGSVPSPLDSRDVSASSACAPPGLLARGRHFINKILVGLVKWQQLIKANNCLRI